MGIDRKDIRNIIHLSSPSNIEEYVQETGHAGCDGLSEAVLFTSHGIKTSMENDIIYVNELKT